MASSLDEQAQSPVPEVVELSRYWSHVQVLNVESKRERAALSQRRNLLFTAHRAEIYVWIPKGPRQLLGSQPAVIIQPVLNDPNAEGYIDNNNPHIINNIIVDDLGLNEVLLLATDSGNVTGYEVEAIFSAINRCIASELTQPFSIPEVRPFFAENVFESAWGLATHKFARLIAVSANTGLITVFAFALVDGESDSGDSTLSSSSDPAISDASDASDSPTWVNIDSEQRMEDMKQTMPYHRTRNLRLSYEGHDDNIPCVSFANFDLDPNGLWMVSTDIHNEVCIWRVWDSLHPVHSSIHKSTADRGWFVLPISPCGVQHHLNVLDACGCLPKPEIIEDERPIIDVTQGAKFVADYMESGHLDCPEPTVVLPEDFFSDPSICDQNTPLSLSQERHSATQLAPGTGTMNDSGDANTQTLRSGMPFLSGKSGSRVKSSVTNLVEEINGHDVLSNTNTADAPECQQPHPVDSPFFPILHFSHNEITLDPYPLDIQSMISVSRNPFSSLTGLFETIICDRINMVKYFPESCLVVAATQSGAAAIITLTWQRDIGHSFRVDWLLPFLSQEREDNTAYPPLMGIAAGPMPGFEKPQDVPCIPQGVNPNDPIQFRWRMLHPHEDGPYEPQPLGGNVTNPPERNPNAEAEEWTLPEIHAHASGIYRPHESWHGVTPSRHYRLLMLYCDHSVMSYEFWHDWRA
ncbi:Ribonucleotide reductase transcriptional regulator CRT10 [Penicillium sp. DV-2018c]|nr:Ribonucleotide reductase transcriptional regulator CRT10 [Penicillium sp. DV-2018c]